MYHNFEMSSISRLTLLVLSGYCTQKGNSKFKYFNWALFELTFSFLKLERYVVECETEWTVGGNRFIKLKNNSSA